MRPAAVRVSRVRRHTADILSVWLRAPVIARAVRAGQFLNVAVAEGHGLLLRRPLSVADVDGDEVRIVFKVVGQGTAILARTRTGDIWDVLGPLGRPAPVPKRRELVLIGGGVGAAPLLLLAREAVRAQNRVTALLGARGAAELFLEREFRRLGVQVAVSTDDGTRGYPGTVAELAELRYGRKALSSRSGAVSIKVFACGPGAMLSELGERLRGLEMWGFFEERMGCGCGICYCCALPKRGGGYVRFCKEGPVVRLDEVEL